MEITRALCKEREREREVKIETDRRPIGTQTASSGIYNNHGMQVCAYAHALNEMISSSVDLSSGSGSAEGRSPQQVTSARVVRFDCRSGKFEDREVKDFSAAFKVFLAALFVFRNGKQKLI